MSFSTVCWATLPAPDTTQGFPRMRIACDSNIAAAK